MIPCRQHHVLGTPTSIEALRRIVDNEHNCRRGCRDVLREPSECSKLLEPPAVAYHNEVPGLAVPATPTQSTRVEDLPEDVVGNRGIGERPEFPFSHDAPVRVHTLRIRHHAERSRPACRSAAGGNLFGMAVE